MLLFPNTKVELSVERPLLPGATIDAEGLACVVGYSAGQFGVQPSTGAAGEKLAGVSLSRPISATHVPVVEKLTVPASGIVTLKAAPLAGSLRAIDTGAGTTYTNVAGAPSAATEVKVGATADITFQTGQAGKVVQVTYERALTVAQAMMLQGNQDIGGPAGAYFGQVGLITRGDVYTTAFDTTADWSNPTDLRLASNGRFTVGGSGGVVPGHVLAIPTEGSAYLGVHINAD